MCKNNKSKLCEKLYKSVDKIDKDDFSKFRKQIMTESDSLTQAHMYFIINRCSFSGATLSGGFSLEASKKRFTTSSVDRINELDLSKFSIDNLDFEEFINKNIDSKNLIFLDPPYYLDKSNLYGYDGDMHEKFDHVRLFNCLKDKKNWILTYNNCNYIKQLYKDYKIIELSWSYGMNKFKTSSKIVIINRSD